mmetsp:Transcript_12700/g.23009  ORF Transcript_12700/g.23009 Transcript_12700/m.23009 type:complete len:81 (-) Transcript_12700:442-684(-)
MALKLSATFLNSPSSFLNRAEVVVVTRRKRPFPTIDAEIYALRSLGVKKFIMTLQCKKLEKLIGWNGLFHQQLTFQSLLG